MRLSMQLPSPKADALARPGRPGRRPGTPLPPWRALTAALARPGPPGPSYSPRLALGRPAVGPAACQTGSAEGMPTAARRVKSLNIQASRTNRTFIINPLIKIAILGNMWGDPDPGLQFSTPTTFFAAATGARQKANALARPGRPGHSIGTPLPSSLALAASLVRPGRHRKRRNAEKEKENEQQHRERRRKRKKRN